MVLAKYKLPDAYYDNTDLEDLYKISVIFDNPTWKQKKEIELYKTLYRGVMLVTGPPRAGKDLFGIIFSYLMKLYFGRPVLLDFKPKRLFGEYIPFDPQTMIREINKMARQAKFVSDDIGSPMSKAEENYFTNYAQEWLNTNETLFKGALLYLSELKRYCYNRNPMSRMNKFVGALCDIHGHLDLLVLGTHIDHREIDYKTFLKNVTIWANCVWSKTRFNNTIVVIRRGSYISELGRFDYALEPFRYWVNGAEPHKYLMKTDTIYHVTSLGKRIIQKSISLEVELLSILQYLYNTGAHTALDITAYFGVPVEVIENRLYTLAEMGFIGGNRAYDLYNTQNPVNLKPVLPKEMGYA